jgi:hypothetical protein
MKGKEIINHIVGAEMPDTEQVRARCVQQEERQERRRKQPFTKLLPIAACIMFMLMTATVANAVTGGTVFDGIKQVLFADGHELNILSESSFEVTEQESAWLVKASWGKLVLTVNNEKIDITSALKTDGYYYHDYRDDAGELHRVYIMKNNGEPEMERWYSQLEWLPERGVGFGRGFSNEMTCVVTFSEDYAKQGADDLDTILQYYLNKYWAGTFVLGEDNRYAAPAE